MLNVGNTITTYLYPLTFLTWSRGRDRWQLCKFQTDAAPSQTDASEGFGRYSSSANSSRRMTLDSSNHFSDSLNTKLPYSMKSIRLVFQTTTTVKHINIKIWGPTSSSISVLLYSRWCRSITEELCSFASGDKLLNECTRTRVCKLNFYTLV